MPCMADNFVLSDNYAWSDDRMDANEDMVYRILDVLCRMGRADKLRLHHIHSAIRRMNCDSMAANGQK